MTQGTTDNMGDDVNEMGDDLVAVDLAGASATAIAAGCDFTCAIVDAGSVMCWYGICIFRCPVHDKTVKRCVSSRLRIPYTFLNVCI